MKRLNRLVWAASVTGSLLLSSAAYADVPSLQVAPLSYSGDLVKNTLASGYIDVANPTDATIQVTSKVRGFRQTGTAGDLNFYDDTKLSNAITVGLPAFQLGPRQQIRVGFTVNPADLATGGIYAAIFFQTQAPTETSSSSFVVQSANVGTLIILNNGGLATHHGSLHVAAPWLQLGGGLHGTATIKNTDTAPAATAFTPALTSRAYAWGHRTKLTAGLLLPGVTRNFGFTKSGSYFGILPLSVVDSISGARATTWILADTGTYRWAVPLAVLLLLAFLIKRSLRTLFARPPAPARRPLDGLSRRPAAVQAAPGPEPEPSTPLEPPLEVGGTLPDPDPVDPAQAPVQSGLAELAAQDMEVTAGLDLPAQPQPKKPTKLKLASEPKAETPKPKRKRKRKRLDEPRD